MSALSPKHHMLRCVRMAACPKPKINLVESCAGYKVSQYQQKSAFLLRVFGKRFERFFWATGQL
jgi:hypothetical protein